MNRPIPPSQPQARNVSLDYLRATLTLMVVAHHSCLAYTDFARVVPHSAPVVDPAHALIFDYLENFNDVFFMSLMFFLSGLFVLPSLRRAGPLGFLGQRLLRLGLPFALGMIVLTPLAYYAAWLAGGHDDGPLAYWRLNLTTEGWPSGPLWFVWVLLLFDAVAAALFAAMRRGDVGTPPDRPLTAFLAMLAICAAAYLPMLAAFGFSRWAALFTKPLYFQLCRILLYFAWFATGSVVGARGIEHGLLSRSGALARHWRWWIMGCVVAYNGLVFLPRVLALRGLLSSQGAGELEAILWVVSCVVSCFAFIALFRGVVSRRRGWMDALVRSAYAIYLIHYVFVLWAQYGLRAAPLPAVTKFALVFIAATASSWLAAQALLKIPGAQRVL